MRVGIGTVGVVERGRRISDSIALAVASPWRKHLSVIAVQSSRFLFMASCSWMPNRGRVAADDGTAVSTAATLAKAGRTLTYSLVNMCRTPRKKAACTYRTHADPDATHGQH
jgi:hypothetical protein